MRFYLLLFFISLLGKTILAQDIVSWNEQVQVIKKCYDLIDGEYNPTVKDFCDIFGPHNEFELALLVKDCKLKGLSEQLTIEYCNKVYSHPNDYVSLAFRKLREKKELIFPVDTKSPLKRIFIALKTSDLKKDKSGQIYGYVNLKVIFKDKNDRFNSVVFQVDTMPVNAPYGSYIGNILLGDGTSLVSSIIADE